MILRKHWRSLSAEQKKDLCERVDVTYDYMRCLVSRGSCGRRLARDIASALHEMGVVKGSPETVYKRVFPEKDAA